MFPDAEKKPLPDFGDFVYAEGVDPNERPRKFFRFFVPRYPKEVQGARRLRHHFQQGTFVYFAVTCTDVAFRLNNRFHQSAFLSDLQNPVDSYGTAFVRDVRRGGNR